MKRKSWFFENKPKKPYHCIVPQTKVLQVHDEEPKTKKLSKKEKRKIAKKLGYSLSS